MCVDLPGILLGRRPEARVTIVVAHPDDETIGVGSRLAILPGLTIVHITDGSPQNLSDARRHGFGSAADYAAARRRELQTALREACATPNLVELGISDQAVAVNLSRVTLSLAAQFARQRPDLILTHPYEGGHPDHDATAFAVAAAADLSGLSRSKLVEFTGYHNHRGELRTGVFLPNGGPEIVCELTTNQQAAKRKLLDCFVTQHEVLKPFDIRAERFRVAPRYDFGSPPHAGQLWYERFDWGLDGRQFRRYASRVAEELELATLALR